jgi:thymidylate kinase
VREGFIALAVAEPTRFVMIDASRPSTDVATAVNTAVDRLVGRGEPKPFAMRTHP